MGTKKAQKRSEGKPVRQDAILTRAMPQRSQAGDTGTTSRLNKYSRKLITLQYILYYKLLYAILQEVFSNNSR